MQVCNQKLTNLLDSRGLSYRRISNIYTTRTGGSYSAQSICRVVHGQHSGNAPYLRVFISILLQEPPSRLWEGLLEPKVLMVDDYFYYLSQQSVSQ